MDRVLAENANSFLVVRLGAIGDALRVCAAVRRLRRSRPDATIGWAVEHWVHPLIAHNPNVDRFHILDRRLLRRGWPSAARESMRFAREIRAERYDVILDFHGRFKSGCITRASGSRCRLGFGPGQSTEMNHLFTNQHVLLEDPLENRVLRFLHLLEPLGIDPAIDPEDLGIDLPESEEAKAADWYREEGRPELAAFPSCSGNQAAYHRWPAEKWIAVLNALGARDIRTVLFWGSDDLEWTQGIDAATGDHTRLAPPTSLIEMMAMLKPFRAFAGSNTAAMHMAWLQGVPTAVFTGPAEPRTDAPLPHVPSRVLRAGGFVREGMSKRRLAEVVSEVPVEETLEAIVSLLEEG